MNIYLISGLGADEKAFERLRFPEGYTIIHLPWIEPESMNEALSAYAGRMAVGIDFNQSCILGGLSFGGIIAIEMQKLFPHIIKGVVLFSSISHRNQLPVLYRMLYTLKLHNAPILYLLRHKPAFVHWLFQSKSPRLNDYLDKRLDTISENYLRWSLAQIASWNQNSKPQALFHIHGTKDSVFPKQRIQDADVWIHQAGHFMVLTHATKVSEAIERGLQLLTKS